MGNEDWERARAVAIFLNGRGIPDRDALGQQITDDSFLLLVNPHHHQTTFTLPDERYGRGWEIALDTADPLLAGHRQPRPNGRLRAPARSMLVLRSRY